jgi:hypothetical protein
MPVIIEPSRSQPTSRRRIRHAHGEKMATAKT